MCDTNPNENQQQDDTEQEWLNGGLVLTLACKARQGFVSNKNKFSKAS